MTRYAELESEIKKLQLEQSEITKQLDIKHRAIMESRNDFFAKCAKSSDKELLLKFLSEPSGFGDYFDMLARREIANNPNINEAIAVKIIEIGDYVALEALILRAPISFENRVLALTTYHKAKLGFSKIEYL